MNFRAKKSGLVLLVVLLVAGLVVLLAGGKNAFSRDANASVNPDTEAIMVENMPELAVIEPDNERPRPPFEVKILITRCKSAVPKVKLEAVVGRDNGDKPPTPTPPAKYSFVWEVNGVIAGRGPVLDCFCAPKATVIVTRLSDRKVVRKTVKLMMCNSNLGAEPSNNTFEQ